MAGRMVLALLFAEGTMRYKPGDPQYEEIKKHIGGSKPGETKPVRPWC